MYLTVFGAKTEGVLRIFETRRRAKHKKGRRFAHPPVNRRVDREEVQRNGKEGIS